MRVWACLAACAALGCSDDVDAVADAPASNGDEVVVAPIDPDVYIDVLTGEDAGVFIEYETGGFWRVFATCDSRVSGLSCSWDIVVSLDVGESLTVAAEDDLEPDDEVVRIDEGAVQLLTFTDYDLDGIFLEASPGVALRVDARFDGWPDPRILTWVGGGGLHVGAPTNPLDLSPTAP